MKKIILICTVLGLVMSSFALAQTSGTSLSGTVTSSGNGSWRWCNSDFMKPLYRGTRGADVRELQQMLVAQGLLQASHTTGYYGSITADAVARMQAREGVATLGSGGSGRVGPKTWKLFKQQCRNTTSTGELRASVTNGSAPLAVTFYTNISAFRIPTVWYEIEYGDGSNERAENCLAPADACIKSGENKHTYTTNGNYTATLYKVTDPCPDDGDPTTPRCMAMIYREAVDSIAITVGAPMACTMQYQPVCGAKQVMCITSPCNPVPTTYGNACTMRAAGATYLYDGECKTTVTIDPSQDPQCKQWFDGCNSCSRSSVNGPGMCTLMACLDTPGVTRPAPYCKSYFTDSGSRSEPVISGFSGPTTLRTGQLGTWSVTASDPQNGTLSYAITWGDEQIGGAMMDFGMSLRPITQVSTFSHVYARSGTYSITVTVTDNEGKKAVTTSTVVIQ